jgi:hypothetical protein
VLTNEKRSDENRLSVCIILATGPLATELFTALREHVFTKESSCNIPKSKTGQAMEISSHPQVVERFTEMFELGGNSAYVLPASESSARA